MNHVLPIFAYRVSASAEAHAGSSDQATGQTRMRLPSGARDHEAAAEHGAVALFDDADSLGLPRLVAVIDTRVGERQCDITGAHRVGGDAVGVGGPQREYVAAAEITGGAS
jgi:hypothetical protein